MMGSLPSDKRDREEAALTRPPRGYTGSLAGTPWDEEAMLASFDTAEQQYKGL